MTQQTLLYLLEEKLATLNTIKFAYIFGSYARGTQKEKSDVDIAVFLEQNNLDAQLQIRYELSKFLKKDVDLVLLNDVKNLFLLADIFRDKIVLKDSDERVDFELKKEHDILDYKEFKRALDAA